RRLRRRQRHGDEAPGAVGGPPAGDGGAPPEAGVPAAPEGEPGAAAAGRHHAGARGAGVRGRGAPGGGAAPPGPLAARAAGAAGGGLMREPAQTIPVARPSLGEAEAAAAREAILSGWVTQGPQVAAFEEEFAAFVGARHACAVSSCTTALHLALLAVGVRPGDEVVTVSHSFIATANAVRYCGATPVFVDIDPRTYNMEPALLEAAITPRTRAVLPVHQMGVPCDLGAILAVARRHGL